MDAPLLTPDFSEFLKLLNAHGVEYLLVGGYAVALHGYPRATVDLDVWVRATPANAERILDAIRAFGFDSPQLEPRLFTAPDQIVRFGVPPFRIEIMTSISGVTFETCHPRAIRHDVGGVEVPVISLEDLKANKRAAGRHKDLADLEELP
jgi:predicted nucleotidyltransferase